VQDEAEIIANILAGDRELYHALIRPYEHSIYRIALSLMRDEADAEDVTQEAFLKAFRKLADFRGEAKFGTWVTRIAINEARHRLTRRNLWKMDSIDEPQDEEVNASPALLRDWREIPSEALERKEIREMLKQAIGNLSDIYRGVVVLRDVEGLSIEETAEALAISTASVKVRLHRARLQLQKELAPRLKSANPRRRWLPWF
jgi:RNA polymerase sigma-70 factor (ECF subfamily)